MKIEPIKGLLCPSCQSRKWVTLKYNAVTGIFTKKCFDCNHTLEFD